MLRAALRELLRRNAARVQLAGNTAFRAGVGAAPGPRPSRNTAPTSPSCRAGWSYSHAARAAPRQRRRVCTHPRCARAHASAVSSRARAHSGCAQEGAGVPGQRGGRTRATGRAQWGCQTAPALTGNALRDLERPPAKRHGGGAGNVDHYLYAATGARSQCCGICTPPPWDSQRGAILPEGNRSELLQASLEATTRMLTPPAARHGPPPDRNTTGRTGGKAQPGADGRRGHAGVATGVTRRHGCQRPQANVVAQAECRGHGHNAAQRVEPPEKVYVVSGCRRTKDLRADVGDSGEQATRHRAAGQGVRRVWGTAGASGPLGVVDLHPGCARVARWAINDLVAHAHTPDAPQHPTANQPRTTHRLGRLHRLREQNLRR